MGVRSPKKMTEEDLDTYERKWILSNDTKFNFAIIIYISHLEIKQNRESGG